MRKFLFIWLFAAFCSQGVPAYGQDISGSWRGATEGAQYVVRLTGRADSLHGVYYSIADTPPDPTGLPTSHITLQRGILAFEVPLIGAKFEGSVARDAKSIAGIWTTPGGSKPLTLMRENKKEVWSDPSPHKVEFIEVDKDIRLEVLDWGGNGPPLVFLAGNGVTAHNFDTFAP